MAHPTRRDFLKSSLAAAVVGGVGGVVPASAAPKRATDWVALGNSGVKVTRLAFGTGTFGGRVQRQLGQEQFTTLVRHAYDRGIRFFERISTTSTAVQDAKAINSISDGLTPTPSSFEDNTTE